MSKRITPRLPLASRTRPIVPIASIALTVLLGTTSALADQGGNGGAVGGNPGGNGGAGVVTGPGNVGNPGTTNGGGGGGGAGQTGGSGGVGAGSGGGTSGAGGSSAGASGSTGGSATAGGGGGGGGGGGADASVITSTTTQSSALTGGNGGNGGAANTTGGGGGGGEGGYGIVINGAGLSLTNSSTINGGNGGTGGNGAGTGNGGNGGDGGFGVLAVGGGTITNTGSITGGNGGTFGTGATAGATGAGGIGIKGASLTVIDSGTISGGSGAGGIADAIDLTGGANTLTLSGSAVLNGAIEVDNTATLNFNQASAVTLANTITGGGGIIQSGTGTLTLTGTNTYTGGTTIQNGATLIISNDVNLGGAIGGIAFNNGTLQFTGAVTSARAITFSAASSTLSAATFNNGGNTVVLNGVISGTGGLTSTGAGTLRLGAANTYTGATVVQSGTLQAAVANALPNTTDVTVDSGATLDLNSSNQQIDSLAGSGNVTLGSATLDVNGTPNTTFSGGISGIGGILKKDGLGTLTLTGVSSYTGGTIIDSGTLAINGDASLGNPSGAVTFNGGTLQFNAGVASTRAFVLGASGGIINTQGNVVTLSGLFSGAAQLTVAGSTGGALVLVNNDSWGGTTINAGATLQVGNGGSGAAAGMITGAVTDNGTLAFDRSDSVTFSGLISGTGSLTQLGGGTLILNGLDSYTGTTTINAGTLQVGDGTAGSIASLTVVDNGTLAFDLAGATAYAGAISGSGALDIFGTSATLTLTGTNTYTGGTTIAAGDTLQIGAGGTKGSLPGGTAIPSVTDNGTLAFDLSSNVTFSGVVGGSGGLAQAGTGILTLTGTNTYSGGTTVTAGLIDFKSAANFGSGLITLNGGGLQWATATTTDISAQLAPVGINGGTFDTNGNNVTLASIISGSGGITKVGTGILTLTNTNTYAGGTTVDSGEIDFNAAGNFGAGLITLNGGGLQWATGNTTDISAQLAAFGTNGATFDTNGNNVAFAGVLTGTGGLTKVGLGMLTLGATETYTGATVVSGGTLDVTSSIATSIGTTVQSGGTLTGTGTVSALTVTGTGVVDPGAPGAASGVLTVSEGTGNSTIGGTLDIFLTSAGSNKLAASNTATIGGGLLLNPSGAGFTLGQQFVVLTTATPAAGANPTLTGIFSSVTTVPLAGSFGSVVAPDGTHVGLVPELSYTSDSAVVTLDASQIGPFVPATAGANAKNVAAAIDFAMTNDGATATFAPLALESQSALVASLASFSGEVAATAQDQAITSMTSFLDTLAGAPTVGGSNNVSRLASNYDYARVADNGPVGGLYAGPSTHGGFDLWGGIHGDFDSADGNASLGTHSTSGEDYGAVIGMGLRARSGHALIGFALGYDDLTWSLSQSLGRGHAGAFQGGLYTALLFADTYLAAQGSFGSYSVTTNRTVQFNGANTYAASFTSNDTAGRVELGQRFGTELGWLMPYVDGGIQQLHTPAYSETTSSGSSSFALSYAQKSQTDLTGELGAEYDSAIGEAMVDPFSVHARLGWLHDFAAGISDTATFEGYSGATFSVHGPAPSKDAAHALLGFEQDYGGLAMTLDANGLLGTSSRSVGADAGLAYRW